MKKKLQSVVMLLYSSQRLQRPHFHSIVVSHPHPFPSLHPRILPSKNPSCLFYDMQMAEWRLSFKLSGPSVNMPVLFPRLFARALGSRSRLREGYQLARSNIAFLSARERGGPCERADVLSCPPHSRCFGLWVCLVRDKREPERIPRP